MELEDLQKKLYTPETPTLPPVVEPAEPQAPPAPELSVEPVEEELPPLAWRRIKIGLAVFLLLALSVSIFIFYRGFYAFRKDRVVLELVGPESITAGEVATWKVKIANRNESDLRAGELVFNYPDFAQPVGRDTTKETVAIASLPAGRMFEQEFKAVIIGGEGFERSAKAVFKFKPTSGEIIFETSAGFDTKISSFPVALSVSSPPETISEETVEVKVDLKNESETDFEDMRVRLEYPAGFKVASSSDKLFEFNNVWRIDSLLRRESKELTVTGKVSGIVGETKIFRAFVEGREIESWRVYKEGSGQVKIDAAPLALNISSSQALKNQVRLGGYLDYKISWTNNLNVPLENLTVAAKLEGELFDFGELAHSGSFDPAAKTITWNKQNAPGLAAIQPAAENNLGFRIKLKSKSAASNTVKVSAVIESASKPEGLAISKISATGELSLDIPSD